MLPVISISREFGSGGHSIASKVAEELGVSFYDSEIVNRVARESGYAKDVIERKGEDSTGDAWWFDISSPSAQYFQSPQDEIFLIQQKVILECAGKGPCVIVGRCSDYILKEAKIRNLSVLIHADMEHRIARILNRYGEIQNVDVKKRILKKDKQRRTYYKYYTDQTWGDYPNYDLSLDSGKLGEDLCVKTIVETAKVFPY